MNPFKKGPGGEEQAGAILATPRPGDFSEAETFLSYHTVDGELPSFVARAPSTLQVPP